MKSPSLQKLCFSAIFAASLLSPVRAADDGADAVTKANEAFYSALNVMFTGDVEPMLAVWSHADDAIFMGPEGGVLTGWKDIAAEWKKQADAKLGGKVEPEGMQMLMGDTLAVVHNTEVGNNVDEDGKPIAVSIRATNVFRKEDGAWKMISHHTDILPFLAK